MVLGVKRRVQRGEKREQQKGERKEERKERREGRRGKRGWKLNKGSSLFFYYSYHLNKKHGFLKICF